MLAFAIVAGMMALFVWGRFRYDVVAALSLLVAVVVGIVPADKAFSGFSDDIVIIVAGALVVSGAIAQTGLPELALQRISRHVSSTAAQIFVLVATVTVLSAFVKNVGALAIMLAHADLESITVERDLIREKQRLEPRYAELVYDGLWFSPLKQALDAFVDSSQKFVTGDVRLELSPGNCQVVGRRAPKSLYDYGLATYDAADHEFLAKGDVMPPDLIQAYLEVKRRECEVVARTPHPIECEAPTSATRYVSGAGPRL